MGVYGHFLVFKCKICHTANVVLWIKLFQLKQKILFWCNTFDFGQKSWIPKKYFY